MQYVNAPVSPRIAWLPLALPASHWLKRYHCLFCKQRVMFVSKVTVALLLPSRTKLKWLQTPESIPLSLEMVGRRKELVGVDLWTGYWKKDRKFQFAKWRCMHLGYITKHYP